MYKRSLQNNIISKEIKYLNDLEGNTMEKHFFDMMRTSSTTKSKDKSKLRHRRSLPLIRLAMDPNSKLNMPKTLENIGTIARNSFEDKHAPMYHVRNMIGSVKNAFLSGLRMAPQDLIIPSQYRIIDTKEEMAMKPAEIEEIKARAAADATAETEARVAREYENERRRERTQEQIRDAFRPPKSLEVVKLPHLNLFSKLNSENSLKALRERFANNLFTTPTPKIFDESALRRKAFNVDTATPNIVRSRINTDTDEVDPFDFLKTFQKVGAVVRGSIKSGQETIQHISEAAHSARKAYNTARFSAPRVLLPYSRAPVVENENKFMFITPRFLDIEKEEPLGQVHQPMVGMGEIMNAFGVANPEVTKVQKQRIIVEKTRHPDPLKTPIFQARFAGDRDDALANPLQPTHDEQFYIYAEDIDEEPVHPKVDDALQSLQALKDIIGARTITDFLEEMKKDFTSMHYTNKANELQNLKSQLNDAQVGTRMSGQHTKEEELELKQFLNDLFAEQTSKIERNYVSPGGAEASQNQPIEDDEQVGSELFLPANLYKPFMNQANTDQLNEFFRVNGDVEEINDKANEDFDNFLRMHALVAAINPQLYQKLFNETLHVKNDTVNLQELFNNSSLGTAPSLEPAPATPVKPVYLGTGDPSHMEQDNSDKQRAKLHFHEKLTKPFMGIIKPKSEYYYDYGYDDSY